MVISSAGFVIPEVKTFIVSSVAASSMTTFENAQATVSSQAITKVFAPGAVIDMAGVGGDGSYVADSFIGPTAPSYGTTGPVSSTRYFAGGGTGPGPAPAGGGGSSTGSGTVNTGGGAGAGTPSGSGGSGIVMIRYRFQ